MTSSDAPRSEYKPFDFDLEEIFSQGVPPYLLRQGESNPLNASPYIVTREQLAALLQNDSWRLELLDRVDALFADLETSGVSVPAMLIGGGFIRRLKDGSRPRDLDALAFYEISPRDAEPNIAALRRTQELAEQEDIDLRFCPIDADPLVLLRSAIFYALIYSKVGEDMRISNGLILYRRH